MKKKFKLKAYATPKFRLASGVVIEVHSYNPNNKNPVETYEVTLKVNERKKKR